MNIEKYKETISLMNTKQLEKELKSLDSSFTISHEISKKRLLILDLLKN